MVRRCKVLQLVELRCTIASRRLVVVGRTRQTRWLVSVLTLPLLSLCRLRTWMQTMSPKSGLRLVVLKTGNEIAFDLEFVVL